MARHRGGRRTDYEWGSIGDVNLANGIGSAAFIAASVLDFLLAATVMRVRGKVGVLLDAAAVDETAMILVGIIIGRTEFLQAVGTAPEMLVAPDEGRWLWQGQLWVNSGAEAAIVPDALSDSIEIDTKAMAKVKPGDSLALVVESPAGLATDQGGTFDLTFYAHILTGR